jgi:hypothetical protein
MPPDDSPPRDPRERRRPKDSEFYQIPPDLKKEFEVMMAGRGAPAPAPAEEALEADRARRLARASLWLALAGVALVGVGPALSIVLGLMACRRGSGSGAGSSRPAGRAGIALGLLMLLVNAVTVLLVWRLCM